MITDSNRACIDMMLTCALADLQAFSPLIDADVFDVLTPEGSAASRCHTGGTAPQAVRAAIARARTRLAT